MITKKTRPNAAHKAWLKAIAAWYEHNGELLYGCDFTFEFDLHHVVGRSAKHNKVAIGHWWVLPVPAILHDVHSNHPLNVTHHKKAFEQAFKSQKRLFAIMLADMEALGVTIPFGDDVKKSIMEYRK